MDYPPNSKMPRSAPDEPKKKVERVTSAEAKRRKKSLGKQFRETFVGGDAKSAGYYVIFGVLLPAAQDAIVEAGRAGIEKLVFGETRKRRGTPQAGPSGYVSYQNIGRHNDRPPLPRTMSKRSRARHDFDDIVLESHAEAEEVLERLFDLVSQCAAATVADLYELTGLESTHTDHTWGWVDLQGASVSRLRNSGYLLNLPDPEPL